MRKGEPKTSLGLAANAFLKCLRPGAATRYWYATRHTAEGLPRSKRNRHSIAFPRFASIQGARPFKAGCNNRICTQTSISVRCDVSGWETDGSTLYRPKKWNRCVGAWGKICARQTCRCEGQTAAHGQITERKPSVAQFRFLFLHGLTGSSEKSAVARSLSGIVIFGE